jgi:predicted glycosyltransferase
MALNRLDILIYAHDGRGLGHASRSIGIGLALRRIYPDLKVLFVSGCRISQELIGSAPLDWLKLPSYETEVIAGKSCGIDGKSNFTDKELGTIRSDTLGHIIELYKPRVVLADHSPLGKHKELKSTLKTTASTNTKWVLGMRGVLGSVPQVQSGLAGELFKKYYTGLLWYGDSKILGTDHIKQLQTRFGTHPVECGYVSRLLEIHNHRKKTLTKYEGLAGTVSIPWLGESTFDFITELAKAFNILGESHGKWKIFIGTEEGSQTDMDIRALFKPLDHCSVETPGSRYNNALFNSRCALIYGGYNSLMDVLHLGTPCVVIIRNMQDKEQEIHLQQLQKKTGNQLIVLGENSLNHSDLFLALKTQLARPKKQDESINLNGAERAAKYLFSLVSPNFA